MRKRFDTALFALVMLLATAAGSANAEVSAQDAAKLGSVLTPIGAERAGNGAGTTAAEAIEDGVEKAKSSYKGDEGEEKPPEAPAAAEPEPEESVEVPEAPEPESPPPGEE